MTDAYIEASGEIAADCDSSKPVPLACEWNEDVSVTAEGSCPSLLSLDSSQFSPGRLDVSIW
jgi:hypothetical protein